MPGDAFDVASTAAISKEFEFGLAEVRGHCIGEGSRLTGAEPNQLADGRVARRQDESDQCGMSP